MKKSFILIAAILILAGNPGADAKDYGRLYRNLPVEIAQATPPVIPDNRIDITRTGGVGDGTTLNTEAFRKAVSELKKLGGGHLDIPAGTWLTGPIKLESGIDLHLEKGALILFSPDKSLFIKKGKSKAEFGISASKAHDISITGKGTIDGNGQYWRYVKRAKVSDSEWNSYLEMGGTVTDGGKFWFPFNLKGFRNMTSSPKDEDALRNHLIQFDKCNRVMIQGVTIRNSPKFHIVPRRCEDLILDRVHIECPWNAQNGDGIDPGNCRKVLITGCVLSVGDDGICLKGGVGEDGMKDGPCQDFLITGNTVYRAHGGFVVGSEFSGGLDRIVVRDCRFLGTDNGLRFKSAAGRGGECRDVYIYDIRMDDIRDAAITFSCGYTDVTYKPQEGFGGTDRFIPHFSGISIWRVNCGGCRTGIYARGIEGYECIRDVTVYNSRFECSEADRDIDAGTASISLKNVCFR